MVNILKLGLVKILTLDFKYRLMVEMLILVQILKLMLNRDSVIGSQPSGPLCLWQCLYFNPQTLNFERKYWEQLSCPINIFIKPRFYCCPALWVPHPLCQLLSKLSVNISHLSLLLSPLNLLSLLPLLFQIQIYLFCPTSLNIFCLIAKKNPTRNISSYV